VNATWAGTSSRTSCGSSRRISTPNAVATILCAAERSRDCKRVTPRPAGPVLDVGDVQLPEVGPDSRLRWDLNQLHQALNERRQQQSLTWAQLSDELDCTPSRLTNLRTARLADMSLVMRITQWLGHPAAAFIHPAQW
jgi:hypothetical protein